MTEVVPATECSATSLRQSELPAKNWILDRLARLSSLRDADHQKGGGLPLFRTVLERILDAPAYFFQLDPARDDYLKNYVAQNTEEWFGLRKSGPILPRPGTDHWVPSPITASVAGSLFEPYYDQTSQETALKMLGRGRAFNGNEHTRRGHAKEPDIREMLRMCLQEPIDETGVHAHPVFPCCMMVSPDGILRHRPISVEIKCPVRLNQSQIPFGYAIQMLLQAMCQDRDDRRIQSVYYAAASMRDWENKLHQPLNFDGVFSREMHRCPDWEQALQDRALYLWGLCLLMGKSYDPPEGIFYHLFPADWDSPTPDQRTLRQTDLKPVSAGWRLWSHHVPYVLSLPISSEEESVMDEIE